MKAVGIDLAGKEKNPTGVCTLCGDSSYFDVLSIKTLYRNRDVIEYAACNKADVVAIDAPLIEGEIKVREGDRILKKYGALPPTMPSMRELSVRAMKISKLVDREVIEVFPTASAKILGFYNKDYRKMALLRGIKVRNKHEMDAYIAALTGLLYLEGKTEMAGEIVIPAKPF